MGPHATAARPLVATASVLLSPCAFLCDFFHGCETLQRSHLLQQASQLGNRISSASMIQSRGHGARSYRHARLHQATDQLSAARGQHLRVILAMCPDEGHVLAVGQLLSFAGSSMARGRGRSTGRRRRACVGTRRQPRSKSGTCEKPPITTRSAGFRRQSGLPLI